MAEILTTTAPQTHPSEVTWSVVNIHLDKEAPAIKVTLLSNTGLRYNYRAVVSDTMTAAQILVGLSFINQGKFMTVQGKSLEKWALDKIASELAEFVGTVTGTQF
jgi:hypothetical protein